MTMTIKTEQVGSTFHASCLWATAVAPSPEGAVKQLAKCLACSSKPMIALKYGQAPYAPGYSVEYVPSFKHEGTTLLALSIRTCVSVEQAIKEQMS